MSDVARWTLDDPEFDKAIPVHDWRNYVVDHVRNMWIDLSREARYAVYLCCDDMASREHWD
jgi:hypothetical protein